MFDLDPVKMDLIRQYWAWFRFYQNDSAPQHRTKTATKKKLRTFCLGID
jgi:hypothetical protein